MFVHWLLSQSVASVSSHLEAWNSLLVSLPFCYWLRVVRGVPNEEKPENFAYSVTFINVEAFSEKTEGKRDFQEETRWFVVGRGVGGCHFLREHGGRFLLLQRRLRSGRPSKNERALKAADCITSSRSSPRDVPAVATPPGRTSPPIVHSSLAMAIVWLVLAGAALVSAGGSNIQASRVLCYFDSRAYWRQGNRAFCPTYSRTHPGEYWLNRRLPLLTADNQCAADIGIYVHKTVESSLELIEVANSSGLCGLYHPHMQHIDACTALRFPHTLRPELEKPEYPEKAHLPTATSAKFPTCRDSDPDRGCLSRDSPHRLVIPSAEIDVPQSSEFFAWNMEFKWTRSISNGVFSRSSRSPSTLRLPSPRSCRQHERSLRRLADA
ncbi:hypothetical protein PR048_027233 [Dryococelus australis]|uniref:Uncharacterized protein n=1 Tax=Dryococelus australis TaxID=614101 RepID=A0ABQ9GGL5_9NEOP|nr:hypothetical protein PR048_027233 [Dryococelus australis]